MTDFPNPAEISAAVMARLAEELAGRLTPRRSAALVAAVVLDFVPEADAEAVERYALASAGTLSDRVRAVLVKVLP